MYEKFTRFLVKSLTTKEEKEMAQQPQQRTESHPGFIDDVMYPFNYNLLKFYLESKKINETPDEFFNGYCTFTPRASKKYLRTFPEGFWSTAEHLFDFGRAITLPGMVEKLYQFLIENPELFRPHPQELLRAFRDAIESNPIHDRYVEKVNHLPKYGGIIRLKTAGTHELVDDNGNYILATTPGLNY